jgi:hypothetical protein
MTLHEGSPKPVYRVLRKIPADETSVLNIQYRALALVGYNIQFDPTPDGKFELRTDLETRGKIINLDYDILAGALKPTAEALLEPWDGLIDEVMEAYDDPRSVFIKGPNKEHPGDPEPTYTYIEQLFVRAYEQGKFGEPRTRATFGHVPVQNNREIRARRDAIYAGLKARGVKPISLEMTKELFKRAIESYLRSRPTLAPLPTQARPQQ